MSIMYYSDHCDAYLRQIYPFDAYLRRSGGFMCQMTVRRVVRPNGRLIFLEHGRAPESAVAVWQDQLTPIWKRIGGGCHLNRKIDDLIATAGFAIGELRTCYLPGPRPMTYTYQ